MWFAVDVIAVAHVIMPIMDCCHAGLRGTGSMQHGSCHHPCCLWACGGLRVVHTVHHAILCVNGEVAVVIGAWACADWCG